MSGIIDDVEIEIDCECGRKNKKSIGWVKNNSKFTCACGIRHTLDADQFRGKVDKINRKVDGSRAALQEAFKKLGK
jgi:hypothetical protein